MNNNIETILNDLYALDPSLREQEPALKELLLKLIEIRPGIVVDNNFVANLRAQLIARASKADSSRLALNPKWAYSFAALAIVAVALISFFYSTSPAGLKPSVKNVSDSGFGPLALQKNGSSSYLSQSSGRGGGGGGGGIPGSSMIAPPYEPIKIAYEYAGDNFSQDEETIGIYKRVADRTLAGSMAKSISKAGLGLINLSKLQEPVLTDINISEQKDRGYSFSINLKDGWLFIFPNWEKWPQPTPCTDDLSCQRISFIEELQLPSDQDMITIADAFLDEYKINRSGYGKGTVNKNWKNWIGQFPRTETGTQLVPLESAVIYPLIIDGKEVYEEYGSQVGIMVSVNMREREVSFANGIGIQNYEKSNYKAETDIKKILELAKNGGQGNIYQEASATKIVTVKLGTPSRQLVQIYQYKETPGPGQPDLIYVPALVFPVQDISDRQYFSRENVVVPLASELLDQRLAPLPQPLAK